MRASLTFIKVSDSFLAPDNSPASFLTGRPWPSRYNITANNSAFLITPGLPGVGQISVNWMKTNVRDQIHLNPSSQLTRSLKSPSSHFFFLQALKQLYSTNALQWTIFWPPQRRSLWIPIVLFPSRWICWRTEEEQQQFMDCEPHKRLNIIWYQVPSRSRTCKNYCSYLCIKDASKMLETCECLPLLSSSIPPKIPLLPSSWLYNRLHLRFPNSRLLQYDSNFPPPTFSSSLSS